MRWNKVAVISLLLVSLLLTLPFVSAQGPGPSVGDVWDTILEIGSLGFLCERGWFGLGPCDYENNLVALMRVLIGILTFALFYMGASAVPGLREQRNIAITVSIILAIISVIFIPNAILKVIGAAYATVVAVIMIGAPVAGGFLLYRSMSDQHWVVKVMVLVILLIILTLVKAAAGGLIS